VAVDVADVDGADRAVGERVRRLCQAERQAQVLGEEVHGAERQDAERRVRAGEHRRGAGDGAVAAPDHHSLRTGTGGGTNPLHKAAPVLVLDQGVKAGGLQVLGHLLGGPFTPDERSGQGVDDDGDAHIGLAIPADLVGRSPSANADGRGRFAFSSPAARTGSHVPVRRGRAVVRARLPGPRPAKYNLC
jgi:hypothetical protein